jgi:hypothetical protein
MYKACKNRRRKKEKQADASHEHVPPSNACAQTPTQWQSYPAAGKWAGKGGRAKGNATPNKFTVETSAGARAVQAKERTAKQANTS